MDANAKLFAILHRGLPLMFAVTLPGIAFAADGQEPASTIRDETTWTFNGGLGSCKAWNLVGITKELIVSEHASVFATAGLGEMILGAGVAFYVNRKSSGVVASAVAGTGQQFALTYRWKMKSENFLVLGGSYVRVFGFSDVNQPGLLPVIAYEHRF